MTLRRRNYASDEVQSLQEDISDALLDLGKIDILDGRLMQNVELTTGQENLIEHRLGRKIFGYIVVRADADARVWDNDTDTESSLIDLRSSANVTVDLWVF